MIPELIGTHHFQRKDQPSTRRFDGENYDIGLAYVTDRPYPAMVEALRRTQQRLYEVHAGKEKSVAQRARGGLRNEGKARIK